MEKAAHFITTISTHIGGRGEGEALFIPVLMNNPHFLFYQVINYRQYVCKGIRNISRSDQEYFSKEYKIKIKNNKYIELVSKYV